jgi:hypothetical protein
MNPELHHKWNAERDRTRESDKPLDEDREDISAQNRVLLKQNKPR